MGGTGTDKDEDEDEEGRAQKRARPTDKPPKPKPKPPPKPKPKPPMIVDDSIAIRNYHRVSSADGATSLSDETLVRPFTASWSVPQTRVIAAALGRRALWHSRCEQSPGLRAWQQVRAAVPLKRCNGNL